MNGCKSRTLISLLAFMLLLTFTHPGFGQQNRLPNLNYNNIFLRYYQADYVRAGREFSNGARTAFKLGNSRFLDSICYWTMMGECHFHMGNYDQAMELYNTALQLYLTYNNQSWQSRVKVPATVNVSTSMPQRAQITWGASNRAAKYTELPNSMLVLFGDTEPGRALVEGGVVDPARQQRVDVQEIMRCVALAVYRRHVIMGPTCEHDALTQQLSSTLRGNGARGSILGAWNGVVLGLAKSAAGDRSAATKLLARSLQLTGGVDHWLTPVALLELSRLAYQSSEPAVAQEFALEASYCAAVFNQYDLAEEALSFATSIHLATQRTPYPPLQPAIQWAARNRAKLMQASLIVRLAECHGEAGDAKVAGQVLSQLRRATNRTSLGGAVVGSRAKYVSALIQFLEGNARGGKETLNEALKQFQNGSLWLYRLASADRLAIDGSITPRQADSLYELLLRDPTAKDWRFDPMEAIAFLASPHIGAMERWFEIKIGQRDAEKALTISELVKRHRFFSTLPLGGRLLAFRWVLESPEEAISEASRKQRQDFLIRFPEYKSLVDKANAIRGQILQLPLKPDPEGDEYKQQIDLYVQLNQVAEAQEAMLASFALRREPAELAFPPECDLSRFRSRIGEKQIAIVCVATEVGYHFFLVGQETERYLGLGRGNKVRGAIAQLFKELGIRDHSGTLDEDQLRDDAWKEAAFELGKQMFGETKVEDWESFEELIVVPDGALWYLPFELLHVGAEAENSKPLHTLLQTRYSPTLGLAFGQQRPVRNPQRTFVIAGRMHSRMEQEQTLAAFAEFQKDIPTAEVFDRRIKVPMNLMGTIVDQLVVLTDMKIPRQGILGMSPAQADQGDGSTLAGWTSLPWRGPEHLILPGFTSGGASGIRPRANGEELFTATCALMASGVRTILISRWRVGGDNSLRLAKEYTTRLKTMPAAQAIRESVEVTSELEIVPEREPRFKPKKMEQPLKASHPFFWAGHMVMEIPNQDADAKPPGNPPVANPDGKPADPNANPGDPADAGGNANTDDGKPGTNPPPMDGGIKPGQPKVDQPILLPTPPGSKPGKSDGKPDGKDSKESKEVGDKKNSESKEKSDGKDDAPSESS